MSVTIERVKQRAEADAKMHGYYLTPEPKFLQDLLEGLKTNEERYGYPSCPCRPATGSYEQDRDIICPCDYRDPDIAEFGACYCSLYVNKDTYDAGNPTPIPERRTAEKMFPELAVKQTEELKGRSGTVDNAGMLSSVTMPPSFVPSAGRRRSFSP
jgi:ferredoxin-thioredoxin reductase catalytic subunit